MHALLLGFGVTFVAELGDKSQLLALAFAARYRPVPMLVGITVATALVQAFSVGTGALVGTAVPTDAINIVGGLAFLGFAVWTIRGDQLDDDGAVPACRTARAAMIAAGAAFFLAELGDKTMVATITLAATEGLLGTWIGSTLGMLAADALAIVAGALLGKRLPERAVTVAAAASFTVFGGLLIIEGMR